MKSILFAMNHYSIFLGNKLEDSTEDDILDYIQYLRDEGNAESSISLYKSKLRQFFNYCDEQTDDKKYRKFLKNKWNKSLYPCFVIRVCIWKMFS